mmetsp:Transcript_41209/g.78711  ORF Transcript_41209/g.78711 Transcript_41209/m.78711 type:complete len:652 (-) Transcript_41209:364-2319(-)|eukprot:CAMPEP_0114249660 /NCGR_PEP_ID=MMETSP0058-20121206/14268_1 /TAXON_ID=36894 /ORGANISM="Pyramimonas parkeae, CCMP726" /LENGTH=651 /DNA_ID=CAMNT_0001363235 /DNA_START=578 /DNA_END=2533 /DNA_ORIENTATION=-
MANNRGGGAPEFYTDCKNILRRCSNVASARIFRNPVDPIKEGIPDYPDIIKNPMDFGTIKSKIERKEYKSAAEFAADMRLVFSNCELYNGKGSHVQKMGEKVQLIFEDAWRKSGLEDKLAAEPLPQKRPAQTQLPRQGDDARQEKRRRKAELQVELARVRALKAQAEEKAHILAHAPSKPKPSPPPKIHEPPPPRTMVSRHSSARHADEERGRAAFEGSDRVEGRTAKRKRDVERDASPPPAKLQTTRPPEPEGPPQEEPPEDQGESEQLAKMLEFLSHEKLFFFLEQKGVVLNKTDEKTEEGNSEMVMELDLSVLTDEQMEELRQFAAAEKLQMEREAAEAETAPATVAQAEPARPDNGAHPPAAAPAGSLSLPNGGAAAKETREGGSDASSSSSGSSSSSSSDHDGDSVDSAGGSVQGGAGLSTKVSGTTSGGAFFMKPSERKDITLTNAGAWGQLQADSGTEGQGEAGAERAAAAASEETPSHNAEEAAPPADGAGEGKVLLTEFQHFNREQQRRHEALRMQEERAAQARKDREQKLAEDAERRRLQQEEQQKAAQLQEEQAQRAREEQRAAALAEMQLDEGNDVADLEADRAMVNQFEQSMNSMGMDGSNLQRLGLNMRAMEQEPESGGGSPLANHQPPIHKEDGEL